ncbi:helix-turn-helix domain-containing protein [Oceanobacillus locisalsi]|uniref:Helix-turn-helix domain-containing protein n=1 Tax=Oceanobacillus locisalsi TaxID=546107 RepID=A0ABW3NMR9_9BACI
MNINTIIGKKIKKRRQELGMSQKELSSDIGTQAQISKIEKGELNPSSSFLFNISQKLLVDMNYFFELNSANINIQNTHFNEIQNMLVQLKAQRNYTSIKYIVDKELEDKETHYSSYEKNYLLWHKGISNYYLTYNLKESIQILNELIVETTHNVLLNINIKTSIAIIYQEEKKYKQAYQLYKEALNQYSKAENLDDFQTKTKILFGLSQTLTYLEEYTESKKYCLEAINNCINENTLHFLPDSYYQLGNNLVKQNRIDEGIKYIKIALNFFEAQGNTYMVNLLEEKLVILNIPV